MIINSKTDIINWVNDCIQNDVTREQLDMAASIISTMAHDNGLIYGNDWSSLLETLSIDDLEIMAGI